MCFVDGRGRHHYLGGLLKVSQGLTHRWRLWLPTGRTHLAVGLHKLEGLDKAKGLLHAAAHWQVIYAHVLHHTIGVNDEKTPVGNTKLYCNIVFKVLDRVPMKCRTKVETCLQLAGKNISQQ